MTTPDIETRILVAMPTVRDAERTAVLLQEARITSRACGGVVELCRELRAGAGAVLVTDELLLGDASGLLADTLRGQPAWSAVPVIVIVREGGSERVQRTAPESLQSLIVIERPVRTRSLASVVLSALRSRRHQYQIRDAIRAREAHEEQMRRAVAELEASKATLARQAEQLRESDRAKDEFLATLAHELRNPLAPIRTGVNLLASCPNAAVTERTLGVMNRQLAHMVRLIDDLLDVSRITRGKLELKRERVKLGVVVQAALEASRPRIDQGGHTLEIDVRDPEAALEVDPTRIAQVISNLLDNASKYTPPGGKIALHARRDGSSARIAVRDNGVGIAAERAADVFNMFSQVRGTLQTAGGGLGIGLALVKRLVEMHEGTVHLSSAGLGKGSTFEVTLPLAASESVAVPVAKALPTHAAQRHVLVVDDNLDAAEMLALMLDQAGYATATAHDGRSALAAVETAPPDIVILDIGLPDMSGYEVAEALRKTRHESLGLVALTGWGTDEDKKRAFAAGFDAHLTKPVDLAAVHATLASLPHALRK